jgi:light-regulated signal transduction histidine kinase (bacteriophytochrome)
MASNLSDNIISLSDKFAITSERGTGLGLYISKNIVEAHGGKMWTEKTSNGKGAVFVFALPTRRNNRKVIFWKKPLIYYNIISIWTNFSQK